MAYEEKNIINDWIPRTALGRQVMNGDVTSMKEIFDQGLVIREPEIVDFLVPGIKEELIFIGGHPGKGGGMKRTPIRFTNRMHKSGRKRAIHAMVTVGNENGLVGLGYAKGSDVRAAIEKAAKQARMNIVPVRRGCGSWECQCGGQHSIPFKTGGKAGSVNMTLRPAPKGIKLCAADEMHKMLKLAGIKDIWSKSRGQSQSRVNFAFATFEALKKLNKIKVSDEAGKVIGLKEGVM